MLEHSRVIFREVSRDYLVSEYYLLVLYMSGACSNTPFSVTALVILNERNLSRKPKKTEIDSAAVEKELRREIAQSEGRLRAEVEAAKAELRAEFKAGWEKWKKEIGGAGASGASGRLERGLQTGSPRRHRLDERKAGRAPKEDCGEEIPIG